jgi:hypothetical protein
MLQSYKRNVNKSETKNGLSYTQVISLKIDEKYFILNTKFGSEKSRDVKNRKKYFNRAMHTSGSPTLIKVKLGLVQLESVKRRKPTNLL